MPRISTGSPGMPDDTSPPPGDAAPAPNAPLSGVRLTVEGAGTAVALAARQLRALGCTGDGEAADRTRG
ncbi:hypothetical protein, partial [Kitasatospora nipponensis]|uniref:hypothetical protein n=1 Tax=Kitasatospora nipponensis TaxID=258049 RepID=UPI0031D4E994